MYCAAHCELLRHYMYELLSAGVSFIINMQCLMLFYLPDITFPHNGCNVNDSSEACTQRYHTEWGVVLSCLNRLKYSPTQQDDSFGNRNCRLLS